MTTNVIIDTNLWVSFLIGKKMSVLRSLIVNPKISVYVCKQLLDEFLDVSSRPKIRIYISETDIQDTCKLIDMYCYHNVIRKRAISPVRDANDLFLLSFADAIPAEYIITGDKDLLTLYSHNDTRIVTYKEFEK